LESSQTRHFIQVNGVRLRYVESGIGTPIVFLHGFPDFSYSWRRQLPYLSAAGFRCLAPDMRGFNESDKPKHVRDYRVDVLVDDVAEFIEKVAGGTAHVVGHDWGGIIAWYLAMRQPARIRKLVIINAPHPTRYLQELRRGAQLLRSFYVGFFQLPYIPELLLSSFHFALIKGPAARSAEERERYEEALSQPGGLTAGLNYYRAAMRGLFTGKTPREKTVITVPALVLWGERDPALSARLVGGLDEYVRDLQIVRFRDVGHFPHIDASSRVNEELLSYLSK
jgi:pimeloyl-ACP methyl ester carboxylesterase